MAAEALGGSAWELRKLPEPERTFWLNRGLLKSAAVAEAMQQDQVDRAMEAKW